MNGPYLCIGGPLDGQLRSRVGPVLRAALPPNPLVKPWRKVSCRLPVDAVMQSVDYHLKLRNDGVPVWVCE